MNQAENSPNWATLLHLSQLSNFLIPLPYIGMITPILIWQLARSRHPNLDRHGENVINWIISSTIYFTFSLISIVGIVFLPILWGLTIVFPIIAAIKANNGKVWRYPLSINFIRGTFPKQRLVATSLALLILTLPAFLGLAGIAFWANNRQNWLDNAIATQGSVVEMIEQTDTDGQTSYKPIIKFRDRAGEIHKFSPLWSSNPHRYEEGETVEVLYPPEKPESALLNNWWEKWSGITILGIISLIGFVFSLIPSAICFILSRWT